MADTFPDTVPGPSYPISKSVQPRIKRVQFGDGYTQETPDGINYNLYTWNLVWEILTENEKDGIEGFLEDQGGYTSFNWEDPSGTTYLVKCASWEVSNLEPSIYRITATFKQSPI